MNDPELERLLIDIRYEHHLKENDKCIAAHIERSKQEQRERKVTEAKKYVFDIIKGLPEYEIYEFRVLDREHTDPEGSALEYHIELAHKPIKGSDYFELKRMGYTSLHGLYDIVEPDKLTDEHYNDALIAFKKDSIRLLTELKEKLKRRP